MYSKCYLASLLPSSPFIAASNCHVYLFPNFPVFIACLWRCIIHFWGSCNTWPFVEPISKQSFQTSFEIFSRVPSVAPLLWLQSPGVPAKFLFYSLQHWNSLYLQCPCCSPVANAYSYTLRSSQSHPWTPSWEKSLLPGFLEHPLHTSVYSIVDHVSKDCFNALWKNLEGRDGIQAIFIFPILCIITGAVGIQWGAYKIFLITDILKNLLVLEEVWAKYS